MNEFQAALLTRTVQPAGAAGATARSQWIAPEPELAEIPGIRPLGRGLRRNPPWLPPVHLPLQFRPLQRTAAGEISRRAERRRNSLLGQA